MRYKLQRLASNIGKIGGMISGVMFGHGIILPITTFTIITLLIAILAVVPESPVPIIIYSITVWAFNFIIIVPAIINKITVKRLDINNVKIDSHNDIQLTHIVNWIEQITPIIGFNIQELTDEKLTKFEAYIRQLIKDNINSIPGYEEVDRNTYLGTLTLCKNMQYRNLMFGKSTRIAGRHSYLLGTSVVDCATTPTPEVYCAIAHEFLHTFCADEALTTYATFMMALKSDNPEFIQGAAFQVGLQIYTWLIYLSNNDESILSEYTKCLMYIPYDIGITNDIVLKAKLNPNIATTKGEVGYKEAFNALEDMLFSIKDKKEQSNK